MSAFTLKLIAMTTMFIDHIGFQFMDDCFLMRFVGRLAFIIYAFLIAESYYHLREKPERLRVHVGKLLILSLITEVPYDIFEHDVWVDYSTQNVVVTLALGFIALVISGVWYEKWKSNRIISILGCVSICLAAALTSYFIKSEYKFAGVLLIIMFYYYLQKADDLKLPIRFIALALLFTVYFFLYIWSRAQFGGWAEIDFAAKTLPSWIKGTFFAIIPLAVYNRKIGYNSKWFGGLYSVFYPLQFVILIIAEHIR